MRGADGRVPGGDGAPTSGPCRVADHSAPGHCCKSQAPVGLVMGGVGHALGQLYSPLLLLPTFLLRTLYLPVC